MVVVGTVLMFLWMMMRRGGELTAAALPLFLL
jgi:hypothetical protein